MAQLLFQTELGADPIFYFFWYRLKRPKKVFLKEQSRLSKLLIDEGGQGHRRIEKRRNQSDTSWQGQSFANAAIIYVINAAIIYVIMHSFIIYVIMRSFIIYVIMEDSISFDDIS